MSCKSKFKDCTKNETCLLALTVFLIVVIILLINSLKIKSTEDDSDQPQKKICMTETCVRSAATILKTIDQTVDPCDDFYKFACGNFIKTTNVPDEKSSVNKFSLVSDKVKLQLKNLLDQPNRSNDSRPLTLLKTVYKSCMNTTKIENEGLIFVKKIFKELGGWPVVDQTFNEKKFDWKPLLYRLRRSGWNHNIFIKMQIEPDMKNSSKHILTVSQPSTFAYHALKRGFNDSDTQAYYEYMVKMATLFGAHELSAVVEMHEVLYFEMNLTQIIIPISGRRNFSSEYNPMTIRQLQETVHSIPWLQLINNFLAPIEMLNSRDTINVAFPKYFKDLEDLLLSTRKRIIANYMFWYIVRNSVAHLPEKFRNQQLEYLKVTKGISRTEPRWTQCLKEIDKLNVAASSIFVKNFFHNKDKEMVTKIAFHIKDAFAENVPKADWLDSETKERALLKVKKMGLLMAHPEDLLDEKKVEEYYRGLELNPNEYFLKMSFNLSSFLHKKRVKKLRELVVDSEWISQSYSYKVNGFYDQRVNAIEITAALIAQGPFFDPNRPNYINFGSVGEVIGHEIIHAFDDGGRQFDENGNLVDWWTPTSLEIFKRKSDCFIRQYRNLTIPEIDKNLDGNNTLNENIADNGGFKIAYQGYLRWVEGNKEEPMLPGISYTQRQLFWISLGSDGCAKYRQESLRRFMVSGRHAPEYFRIMVPFMNSEYFASDFNCSAGSPMNPDDKCQVW